MKSKVASAVVIGVLFGSYVHHDLVKWHQRGRDAYVAFQVQRFDRVEAIRHSWIGLSIIVAIIMTMLFLGLYELMIFLFSKMLDPKPPRSVPNSPASVP